MTNHWASMLAVLFVTASLAGACTSKDEEQPASVAKQQEQTIEPVEGMRYYVGGPIMKPDEYGRLRLGGFNGEVGAPTTRGLLVGIKVDANKGFDYRTWLNGAPVAKSTGFLDEQGLLWFDERETYDSEGRVIARQAFEYDDEKQQMTSTVVQLDPDTGETLKTHRQEMPYTPSDDGWDDDDDEEEDEDEDESDDSPSEN